MGQRGPQRKSAAWLEVNGSKVDDGRGVATPPGVPVKPDWIAVLPVASAVWVETIADLAELPGLLSTLDGGCLALYCEAWQTFKDASAIVAREGMVSTSEKGGTYQHPAVGIKHKAREAIISLGAKFGLNPQAREGLIVSGPTEDDELTRLLR